MDYYGAKETYSRIGLIFPEKVTRDSKLKKIEEIELAAQRDKEKAKKKIEELVNLPHSFRV